MTRAGLNRRHFVALATALVLGGCASRFGTGDGGGGGSGGAVTGGGGTSSPPPVRGSAAKFAFAPVQNVPVPVLQVLSTALNQEARAQGLNVVPISDPGRTYEVRGFISAVAEGASTKLVYVWDVVDRSGNRLHRISGQEAGGTPAGDTWTGIGYQTVQLTARQTVASLVNWVNS